MKEPLDYTEEREVMAIGFRVFIFCIMAFPIFIRFLILYLGGDLFETVNFLSCWAADCLVVYVIVCQFKYVKAVITFSKYVS